MQSMNDIEFHEEKTPFVKPRSRINTNHNKLNTRSRNLYFSKGNNQFEKQNTNGMWKIENQEINVGGNIKKNSKFRCSNNYFLNAEFN